MAYFFDEEDDEQSQTETRGPGAPAAQAAGQPTQAPPSTVDSGSGYIPVQRYLDVNQNAGKQMVDRLVGDVGTQAQGVQNDLQKQWGEFGQQVQAGTPTAYGQTYSGPQSWEAGSGLQDQAQKVNSKLNQMQSFEGTQSLLKDTYGTTSAGGSMLDALLTGANQGNEFKDLWAQYGQQYGDVQAKRTQADQMVQGAQNTHFDAPAAAPAPLVSDEDQKWVEALQADPDLALYSGPVMGSKKFGGPSINEEARARLDEKYGPGWEDKAKVLMERGRVQYASQHPETALMSPEMMKRLLSMAQGA